MCTCTSGWWYCVYMYLRLVVLYVHVPQFGGIVCTSPGDVVEIDHYDYGLTQGEPCRSVSALKGRILLVKFSKCCSNKGKLLTQITHGAGKF